MADSPDRSDSDRGRREPPPRRDEEGKPSAGAGNATASSGEVFKVFVGGISWHMDDAELLKTFSKYNPAEATIMMDKRTGRSRGFGFVMFRDKASMDEAIQELHSTEMDGRRISVTRAVPQSETAPGTPASVLQGGRAEPGYRSGPYPARGGERGYGRDYARGGYRAGPYAREDDRGYGRDYARGGYRADPYAREDDRGYGRDYARGGYRTDPYAREDERGYGREYARGGYSRDEYARGGYSREDYAGYPAADRYSGGYSTAYGGYNREAYERYRARPDDRR